MDKKIEIPIGKKLAHPLSQLVHRPIVGEQDESVTVSLNNKVFDPVYQSFFVADLARVGHFADHEHFHLALEIKRTAKLQWLDRLCPNTISEIGQVFSSDAQGGAGHDTGMAVAE